MIAKHNFRFFQNYLFCFFKCKFRICQNSEFPQLRFGVLDKSSGPMKGVTPSFKIRWLQSFAFPEFPNFTKQIMICSVANSTMMHQVMCVMSPIPIWCNKSNPLVSPFPKLPKRTVVAARKPTISPKFNKVTFVFLNMSKCYNK